MSSQTTLNVTLSADSNSISATSKKDAAMDENISKSADIRHVVADSLQQLTLTTTARIQPLVSTPAASSYRSILSPSLLNALSQPSPAFSALSPAQSQNTTATAQGSSGASSQSPFESMPTASPLPPPTASPLPCALHTMQTLSASINSEIAPTAPLPQPALVPFLSLNSEAEKVRSALTPTFSSSSSSISAFSHPLSTSYAAASSTIFHTMQLSSNSSPESAPVSPPISSPSSSSSLTSQTPFVLNLNEPLVLVAEDTLLTQKMLNRFFSERRINFILVGDGQGIVDAFTGKAIKILYPKNTTISATSLKIAAIFSDQQMPKMDGSKALTQVRELLREKTPYAITYTGTYNEKNADAESVKKKLTEVGYDKVFGKTPSKQQWEEIFNLLNKALASYRV